MSLTLTSSSQRKNAILFNLASIIALLVAPAVWGLSTVVNLPPMIKYVVVVVPVMLWLAGSIFVYAAIAHHPNLRVRHFNKWAGYRFYGAAGAMVVFGQPIYELFGNGTGIVAVWAVMALVVIPWSLWYIFAAVREPWMEMTVEEAVHG